MNIKVALLDENGSWDYAIFQSRCSTLDRAFKSVCDRWSGTSMFRTIVHFVNAGLADAYDLSNYRKITLQEVES